MFQNVSGSWHWPSILLVVGWLISGVFIFANLTYSRNEREKAGPWKITEAQKEKFSNSLREAPKGRVALEYTATDQVRAHALAVILKDMLEKAGYNVWGYMPAFQQTGNATPVVGIQVGIKDQSAVVGEHIKQAFETIGIDARRARMTNNNYEDDYVVILVGIKP